MAESVLDVLMYLFETSGDDETPQPDRDELRQELERAGFRNRAIDRALDWLDGLALRREAAGDEAPTERSIRVFNREECARLGSEGRGYLMYLEQIGILSPMHRELGRRDRRRGHQVGRAHGAVQSARRGSRLRPDGGPRIRGTRSGRALDLDGSDAL